MKSNWSRVATLMLALLMALSCFAFVGCGNDVTVNVTPNTPDTPDTPADPGTTPEEPEDPDAANDYSLSIPTQNYGKTFVMMTDDGDYRRKELFIADEDEAAGDLMDTAVFYRNNRVAEYLGVTLENITTDADWNNRNGYINRIYQSFSTGDQDFQMASVYEAFAADGAVAGYYYDVNEIDAIDINSPWYVQSWFENTIVNDHCYMIAGDLGMTMWKNLQTIYFNRQISDQLTITDTLYDMAENGDWTMEFLMQCAELSSAEDGNQIWDTADTYGLYLNRFTCRAMVTYFDIPLTQLNDDGEYELCFYNERTEDIYGTLHAYIWDNDYVYKNIASGADGDVMDTGGPMFMEDRLLFLPGCLTHSQDLRAMEGSWGILPTPKLDDNQETYSSHSSDTFSVFIIPGHAEDPEFCGTVVDALSAESKFSVVPTYYDVVLKGRTTKDERDIPMIDIIRDNLNFDFAFAHITAINYMWTHFGQNLLTQANTSFKPQYDKNADTYQQYLDDVMEAYWNVR